MLEKLRNLLQSEPIALSEIVPKEQRKTVSEEELIATSCNWSGYVREDAVKKLAAFPSARALAILIIRLNDWVPQVRQAALEGCRQYFCADRIEMLLANLDAFLALRNKQRDDHGKLLEELSRILGSQEFKGVALEYALKVQGKSARFLLQSLLDSGNDPDSVFETGARHRDYLVRMLIAEKCGGMQILQKLAVDRHQAVRRRATLTLWKHCQENQADQVLQMLRDPSLSIREQGLWCAKQIGFDVDQHLKDQMSEIERTGEDMGIDLLHLTASRKAVQYLPIVHKALNAPLASVRRAALVTHIKLSRGTSDEVVLQALTDPSIKNFRLARSYLSRGEYALSLDQFFSAMKTNWCEGRTDRAISLSQSISYWDRLEQLLRLSPNANSPEEQIILGEAITQSIGVSLCYFTVPGKEQQDRLRQLLLNANFLFPNPDPSMLNILKKSGIT